VFTNEKIEYNGFPKKGFLWDETAPFFHRNSAKRHYVPSEDHSGNSPGAKLEKYSFYETELEKLYYPSAFEVVIAVYCFEKPFQSHCLLWW